MIERVSLTGKQHHLLQQHLHPGDGLEAVAVALCGVHQVDGNERLLAHKLFMVPHEACDRRPDAVTWPSSLLAEICVEADKKAMRVVKLHSHPAGARGFSATDDTSDCRIFASVFGWMTSPAAQASMIMLPDGELIARAIAPSLRFERVPLVRRVGNEIHDWGVQVPEGDLGAQFSRTKQVFGSGTVSALRRLSAAVVGVSGTGSLTAEFLVRLGVGRIVLVEPEVIEEKNLGRILNSTAEHARVGASKVSVIATALASIGSATVESLEANLVDREAVRLVSTCDVAFGCMDSAEGRHVLNRLCAAFLMPYIDMGVRLDADGLGGVSQVCAAVNYVQPDGTGLLERGVFTLAQVEADALRRRNPAAFAERLKEGYLRGVREDRPAVISVNALAAAFATNELLARLHPFRMDPNSAFARTSLSLTAGILQAEPESWAGNAFSNVLGIGSREPLLDLPELSA